MFVQAPIVTQEWKSDSLYEREAEGGLGSFEAESRAPKLREASLTIVAIQQAKLDTEASDFGSVEERARTCKRGRELPGGRSEPKRWLLAGLGCSLAAKAGNSSMNSA